MKEIEKKGKDHRLSLRWIHFALVFLWAQSAVYCSHPHVDLEDRAHLQLSTWEIGLTELCPGESRALELYLKSPDGKFKVPEELSWQEIDVRVQGGNWKAPYVTADMESLRALKEGYELQISLKKFPALKKTKKITANFSCLLNQEIDVQNQRVNIEMHFLTFWGNKEAKPMVRIRWQHSPEVILDPSSGEVLNIDLKNLKAPEAIAKKIEVCIPADHPELLDWIAFWHGKHQILESPKICRKKDFKRR